jgi:hypothetical protein
MDSGYRTESSIARAFSSACRVLLGHVGLCRFGAALKFGFDGAFADALERWVAYRQLFTEVLSDDRLAGIRA